MTLTIHRGTNEIGGSCIEIATESSRVLIDIGLPLDFDKKTVEQKQQIRKKWGQDPLCFEMLLTPKIIGY